MCVCVWTNRRRRKAEQSACVRGASVECVSVCVRAGRVPAGGGGGGAAHSGSAAWRAEPELSTPGEVLPTHPTPLKKKKKKTTILPPP